MGMELGTHPTATQVQPLDAAALAELGRCFRGELIGPGHPSYDGCREVWNGSIDRYPALIGRCSCVADVTAAVLFARRTGVPVAVRGGGHSFAGLSVCDGGIVIDLGPMKQIRVDPVPARYTRKRGSSSASSTAPRRRSALPFRSVR
jgi:FAD binding domain